MADKDTLILIDNGHGTETPGKRSPDDRLREGIYTREIAKNIVLALKKMGYNAELLVPELYDVRLIERVHRVNVKCQSLGKDNVLVVSVHCNAARSDGQWSNATGWECWTSKGTTKSDTLADHLVAAAKECFPDQKIREWMQQDGSRDKEANFTILHGTLCPAVLTENFFMDNRADLQYLLSDEGKAAVVDCHVKGIVSYLESQA